MLKYCLLENPMATDSTNFVAYVSSPENKNLDDVINYMIAEGTGLTRPQAMAYFEKLTQTILYFVGEGHSVTTPLFRVRPTITGLFKNMQDNFDPTRHQVNIRTTTGLRLRTFSAGIKMEKSSSNSQSPAPTTFIDAITKESNLTATAGGIGALYGTLLRFDPDDVQQGVFFAPVDTPETEVRAVGYSRVKPAEIHFQIPNLQQGEYIISVKAISKNGKIINTGKLNASITV